MHSSKYSSTVAIIEEITRQWKNEDIEYAVMHGLENYPNQLGRDLDVWINRKDIKRARTIAIRIFCDKGWTAVAPKTDPWQKKSIYAISKNIFFELDLIPNLFWGPVALLKKRSVTEKQGPFYIDKTAEFVKTILLKVLSGIPINTDFIFTIEIRKYCSEVFGPKLGGLLVTLIERKDFKSLDKVRSSLRFQLIKRFVIRNPLMSIKNSINWFLREIMSHFYKIAPIVAVVGPDGIGKSTTLLHVNFNNTFFIDSVVRHWRPAFLPSLASITGNSDPLYNENGSVQPRRTAGHLYFVRLVYYAFDFLVGHYFLDRFLSCTLRPVLYDRCWLDGWVDPLRYGFSSTWGIKFLYRILPKPDIVVLLYDDPERIHSRKPELTQTEIQEQLDKWMQLFREGFVDAVIRVDAQPEEMAQRLRELIIESFIEMNGGPIADSHEPLPWLEKALGVKISKRNGLSVSTKRFIHLPLPDGRGYILPTEPEAAVNSLSMYSPQKRKSKLAKSLLSIGLRTGIAQHLLPKLELHDFHPLADVIEQEFGRTDLHYAISLGTPGPHRKPVIKAMTRDHKTLGFVKVAWNDNSRKSVINECEILTHFACDKIDFIVPHILYNGEFKNQYISIQSSPKEGAFSSIKKLTEFHVNAVICMSKLHHREKNLPDSLFWQQIMSRIKSIKSPYMINVLHSSIHDIQDYFKSRPIIFHLSHGDFTPWNTVVLKNKLYIYDWEEATYERPAGYDLFHFLVSVLWLVENKSIEEINDFVIDELCNRIDYSKNTNISKQDTKYLFLIYQLDKLSFFLTHSYQSQICNFYSNLLMSRCISEI